jgi:hypothetical protein
MGMLVNGIDQKGEHLDHTMVCPADVFSGLLLLLVQETHEVAGNKEESSPGADIKPTIQAMVLCESKCRRIYVGHRTDENHGKQGSKCCIASAVKISTKENGKVKEIQEGSLIGHKKENDCGNHHQQKDDDEFFVDCQAGLSKSEIEGFHVQFLMTTSIESISRYTSN